MIRYGPGLRSWLPTYRPEQHSRGYPDWSHSGCGEALGMSGTVGSLSAQCAFWRLRPGSAAAWISSPWGAWALAAGRLDTGTVWHSQETAAPAARDAGL